MVVENLTREKWEQLLQGLFSVPAKKRTGAWKETADWIQKIIAGPNNLAMETIPEEVRYAVLCSLCNKTIHLTDDFVFKALTGRYHHYDCHHRAGPGEE